MSKQAQYFLRMWYGVLARLEHPRHSAQFDRELFEDEHRVRILAADLIGWGVSRPDEPAARSGATREPALSAVNPLPNFCQAGVVAPPDSLMHEKSAVIGRGVQA
ncbi:hypothetical protein QMO14_23100 [Variovorax sp. CAN2819]|uniref:hypothetical protein n=1 Tax=Variovorax sp. CAN15 TaxID=3046727 RepID=UPI0026478520|nr:hypothetical protein [Variovorax sp. CAN15]MDN6886483.1 hypothetical protein [Variovorax sp. CAN15]